MGKAQRLLSLGAAQIYRGVAADPRYLFQIERALLARFDANEA